MIIMVDKINNFSPIDDKGLVQGTYYLDQCGNLVTLPKYVKSTPVQLPYVCSVNVNHADDICTIHVSEIEKLIETLKRKVENISDNVKKAKYDGYIEALNYVVSHNSYLDPWADFIKSIEGDEDEE